MCSKHYPEHFFFRWIELRICSDLAHFLGEWRQIEKLSEINPPLWKLQQFDTVYSWVYATPFTVHKRWVIVCRSFHVRGPHILQWIPVRTTCIDTYIQGRTKWRNCRLTTKNPDYQLGWALLAECMQLDTHQHIFI